MTFHRVTALVLACVFSTPAMGAPIALDAAGARRAGVQTAPAQPAAASPVATLPGTVVPRPQGRVAVSAPFAGVVRQSLVVEGDAVQRGQRLAVVQSREVLTTGAELARARARLGVARQAAARTATLAKEGVVSGARAEEANAALREAESEVGEKSRILKLANADAASGVYVLTAPIAGRVTQANAQTGAAVDGLSAPFVIDAPGPYHVQAQAPARLAGVLRPGMRVRLQSGAEGRILTIGSTVDAATRSLSVRAAIDSGPPVQAGASVSLVVLAAQPAGAVSVPSAAVVQIGGRAVVFVQTAQGFDSRPVRVLGAVGGRSTLSGLSPGARVAITGVSALKSLATGG